MTISHRKGLFAGTTTIASIALACITSLGISPVRADSATSSGGPAIIRSILLFPIANNAGAPAAEIGPLIDDAVRLRLASVNRFRITRFSRLLPSVQQGMKDRELTSDDVAAPFGDTDRDQPRAAKIAQRMDVDAYFVGELDSYSVDTAGKTVSLQITGSLYFTQTGEVAKSVGTSVTDKAVSQSEQIDAVVQSGVNDAAGQIASSINGLPVETASVISSSQRGHHSVGAAPLLVAVIGGAILYAALHHDSSSGGGSSSSSGGTTTGSTGGPPPPPTP